MADIIVELTSPLDTVVVKYPPEWGVKVLEKFATNTMDPLDMWSIVGVKVVRTEGA